MNPKWSREAAKVVNSRLMLERGPKVRGAFVAAAEDVESADELPEEWRRFVAAALASGPA